MNALVPFVIFAGGLAATMGFFTWLAVLVRRRGVAGGGIRAAMASYDEAFFGTAHDSYYEIKEQADRKVPMLSPDDPWRSRGGEAGHPNALGGRQPLQPHPRRLRRHLHRRIARLWRRH